MTPIFIPGELLGHPGETVIIGGPAPEEETDLPFAEELEWEEEPEVEAEPLYKSRPAEVFELK